MTKCVLYLDQSYVSNLTKVRLGSPGTHDSFAELAAAITEAISVNKLVCPISHVHSVESELAPSHLEQNLYDTLEAFSCGVEFLPYPEILEAEVRKAYCKFLNREVPPDSWQDVFNRDPDGDCASGYRISRSRGYFKEWILEARRYHEQVGVTHRELPYAEQKAIEAAAFIRTLYIEPWESWQAGATDPVTVALFDSPARFLRLHADLTGERLTLNDSMSSKMLRFFVQLAKTPTPYIDIYASMVARIATQDPDRRARGGDLQDVSADALAMPHCHVYTTDNSMKALIQAIGLDDRYRVAVYSPKPPDVARLAEEIKRL